MRTSFIACLLCVLAAAAGAQHATQTTPKPAGPAAKPNTTATARAATASARPTVELIKAAGAATAGEEMSQAPRGHATEQGDRNHPSGLAMLLVGLAVMLGIALRRFSSRGQ